MPSRPPGPYRTAKELGWPALEADRRRWYDQWYWKRRIPAWVDGHVVVDAIVIPSSPKKPLDK